jgi:hypothetical protein
MLLYGFRRDGAQRDRHLAKQDTMPAGDIAKLNGKETGCRGQFCFQDEHRYRFHGNMSHPHRLTETIDPFLPKLFE